MKNKKIRLLVGINNFNMAGAQKLATDQLNNFDRDKYELALLTFFRTATKDNFFDLLSDDIKNYRLNFKNFYDIKSWFKTYKILREYKPDIILSHLFFSNTILRALKPFFRYRVSIYEHNTYVNKTRSQILVDKILSYFTYKIIVASETVKNFTVKQEKINLKKFITVPYNIDYHKIRSEVTKYSKNALKQKLGFKKEDKLIINAARLNWQKNHQLLIDSFAEFSKENSEYKLIILGEGPLYSELKERIRSLKLEEKILLLGLKRNVIEYLSISEFYILTSRIEGLSIALLEAIAAGLPIVSTGVSGSVDLIVNGFNGYLAEDNKKDIVQKMQEVVKYGQDYFSENCQTTAQKYDIKNIIKKLEATI